MPSEADEAQLEAVLSLVRETFGDDLAGAYLYGSAVMGGLTPSSDLDVLAVSRRPTTAEERERLASQLLEISGGPRRSVELTVVDEAELRRVMPAPVMDFQYGDWLRKDMASGRIPPPARNPDLLVLTEMARLHGRALVGPAPADMFAPVAHEDLVAAMVSGVDGLLADLACDTRNVLLTLARIWMTCATGKLGRKDDAARWSAQRLPSDLGGVLKRARELYLAGGYGPWGELEPLIAPTAERLVCQISRGPTGAG